MDSGRFESVSRPYAFHQVMRGLFVPLRLATDARNLELVTDLDPCIDKVAFLLPICPPRFSRDPSRDHSHFSSPFFTLPDVLAWPRLTAEFRSHWMQCT